MFNLQESDDYRLFVDMGIYKPTVNACSLIWFQILGMTRDKFLLVTNQPCLCCISGQELSSSVVYRFRDHVFPTSKNELKGLYMNQEWLNFS